MDHEELVRAVERLYDSYLDGGCPCRFPRFRALARQWGLTSGVLSSEDRDRLVQRFRARVPLRDVHAAPAGWRATCECCEAAVEFGSVESSPGGTVEYISLDTHAADLGAPLVQPLFRCRPWRATGPGYGEFVQRAGRIYVFVEIEAWVEWLRARASGPT